MSKGTDALLYHPDVVKVITAAMRSAVPQADIEDAIHDVQMAAWEWTRGRHPTTAAEWRVVCRSIAKNLAIKARKKRITAGKRRVVIDGDAGELSGLANPEALDGIDVHRAYDDVCAAIASGELGPDSAELIDAIRAGVSMKDYAQERGRSYDAVRKQSAKITQVFEGRLVAIGMMEKDRRPRVRRIAAVLTAVVVAIALVVFIVRRDNEPVAHHKDVPVVDAGATAPVPSAPQVLVETAAEKRVKELMLDAEDALAKKDPERCLDDLHTAYPLDAGSQLEMVRLASKCAEMDERLNMSKGGPRPEGGVGKKNKR